MISESFLGLVPALLGRPAPSPVIEERGADWFVPAHPPRATGPRRYLRMLFQARRNLLSAWHSGEFRARSASFRLFRRQLVLVNHPDDIKHVLVTRHDLYERKSPQMRRALEMLIGDGLFISDGDTWRSRRPLVADIVHKNRVPAFAPVMEEVAGDMARRWSELPPGTTLNALHEMAGLTAEIIARSVFGRDLGQGEADEVIEGFTRYQHLVDSTNIAYFLGLDDGLPMLRGPRLRGAVRRVHRVIDRVVGEHLAGRGDHEAMLDLLVRRQQRSPELGLDVAALRNEAATIFMAGHETTAATLTWAWYLLANAPWVETAVHEEIARVCGDRAPQVADVPRLAWCRAVIEETLRLYPPVPVLARQAKAADRIGAIEVEPASLILIVPWLLHRSPGLWDRPDHFLPERFLGEARPAPYTYIPFAAGPRLCPGLNFGLVEAVLCLAVLAQRFTVRVADGHRVEPWSRLTVRPRGGLPVTVHPR